MKNSSLKYAGIFAFAFIWILSLTYNFNFFWEDAYILGQYDLYLKQPEMFSAKKIATLFVNAVIRPEQFFSVRYGWKPLQEGFIYPFIVTLFGNNVLHQRIFKAALYASLILVYFCFLKQISNNYKDNIKRKIFLLLSFGNLLLIPEIWTAQLYLPDTLILTLLFATTALFIFYFYYDKITNNLTPVLFLLILALTQMSIVTKHVGRLNVAIITLFLLFTKPKKIIQKKYAILILTLLFLSFPILGLFNVVKGQTISDITGISGHTSQNEMSALFLNFLKTIHYSFIPHTTLLLLLLCLSFAIHIYSARYIKTKTGNENLKELVIFSFFWFLLSAFAMHIARGFIFDPKFFLRFEFTIFIFPQILFVLSYATFVYKKYFPKNKIVPLIIYGILIITIINSGLRLNEWRGGWGAYFLAYDTARAYVDSVANNSILLVKMDHAAPTYFISNNTILMTADMTNQTFLRALQKKYSQVFVADPKPLQNNTALKETTTVSIKDSSPYGIIKKLLRRDYSFKIAVYKFQPPNDKK